MIENTDDILDTLDDALWHLKEAADAMRHSRYCDSYRQGILVLMDEIKIGKNELQRMIDEKGR